MLRVTLVFICELFFCVVNAQSLTDTSYYDKDYAATTKEKAFYLSPPAEKVRSNHYKVCYYLTSGAPDACITFRAVKVNGRLSISNREAIWDGPYTWYRADGSVYKIGEWKENALNGVWRTYYPNGKIESSESYSDSGRTDYITFYDTTGYKTWEGTRRYDGSTETWKDEGYWKRYYPNSGNIKGIYSHRNGVYDGQFTLYDSISQKVKSKGNYVSGKLHGTVEHFDINGQLEERTTYENDMAHGAITGFFPETGIIAQTGYYKNDKRDSVWNFYSSDGKHRYYTCIYHEDFGQAFFFDTLTLDTNATGFFKGAAKHGKFCLYFQGSRTPKNIYESEDGLLHGWYRTFDVDGYLIEELPFVKGALDGIGKVNYPHSDKVWMSQEFVRDTLHGLFRIFYRNGALKRKVVFVDGVAVEQTCYSLGKEEIPCQDIYVPASFSEDVTNYVRQHLKYPSEALKAGIYGKTVISFTVNEDGKVENAVVVSGFNKQCDAEALRVIASMPKWAPAAIDGETIRSVHKVTVPFVMD